jgi:hypothetical protein
MNDQFGNYVCQKFFECCDQSFISKIINNVSLYLNRLNILFTISQLIVTELEPFKGS